MSSEGIGSFLSVLRKYASLGAAGFLQLNPDDFFFLWHHFFLIILPSSILVRALSNLTVHTSVLPAKTLPLPCLFHNHAYGMLSDGVDSSSFAMVTLVRCFLSEQFPFPWCQQYHLSCRFACAWPKDQLCFPKGLEKVEGASPLFFCVCHFSEFLKDGHTFTFGLACL